MLVTTLCWLYVDFMIVTDLRFWQSWLLQCIKSAKNISNRSPTSKSCHQHILSPTFIISNVRNRSKIKFLVQKSRSKIVYCNWSHILGEKSEFRPCFVVFFNILRTVYLWYWVKIYYSLVLWQFCFFPRRSGYPNTS